MHHSDKSIDPEQLEALRKLMSDEAKKEKLGATGEFPEGKLADHDEGELKMGVTTHNGKVILNFGKSVKWIGMDRGPALHLARIIKQRAMQLQPQKKRKRKSHGAN